jgi:hypothetical protein
MVKRVEFASLLSKVVGGTTTDMVAYIDHGVFIEAWICFSAAYGANGVYYRVVPGPGG